MKNEELVNVKGGAAFNASIVNAISRGVTVIYNIGRSLGSTVKMLVTGRKC